MGGTSIRDLRVSTFSFRPYGYTVLNLSICSSLSPKNCFTKNDSAMTSSVIALPFFNYLCGILSIFTYPCWKCFANHLQEFDFIFPLILQSFSSYLETFWCFTKCFFHQKWNDARLLHINMVKSKLSPQCATSYEN